MHRAPLDELDDLGPPPPLPLIRFCGAPGCKRRARPGGRHCAGCNAAAVRRWRSGHRRELTVRRRDAAALRDEGTRARDSARAKLAVALRRGTLERGRCAACGETEVTALIADPAAWREVVWICREHRETELERRRGASERRTYEAKQVVWYDERARVLAAIELLPPAERAELHALAARGPAGMRLLPGAPLYVMNLVHVYNGRFATAEQVYGAGGAVTVPNAPVRIGVLHGAVGGAVAAAGTGVPVPGSTIPAPINCSADHAVNGIRAWPRA